MTKPITEYTTTELKAMAFDAGRQLSLLRIKQKEIVGELLKRQEIIMNVEVTPDDAT